VGQIALGDTEVLQLDAVEPGGEVAQGVVTPLADVGDDLPDGPEWRLAAVGVRAGEGRGEVASGPAANVEAGEHR